MNSFLFDIGQNDRVSSRFISHVRREVQDAFLFEKQKNKLTQQQLAKAMGVNRSCVNRQLHGLDNMTLRSVALLLHAMGWRPEFRAVKDHADDADSSNTPIEWSDADGLVNIDVSHNKSNTDSSNIQSQFG